MPQELRDIEPFYGWLHFYSHDRDPYSPFHEVEHNLFQYDRSINAIPAHPLWDDIASESLLVKILYVHYGQGYAIIELFGEWNDLYDNDFKLLSENCLTYLVDRGVDKFILICENVFHAYLDADDYYQAMWEELDHGWICALRLREEVREEMTQYGIDAYFYWNDTLDELRWRQVRPQELYALVSDCIDRKLLP
ncbi:MAG: hypothetical protein D6722_12605 [Bacteroidetes bacterium]|nr:MAG: hypothetical protein D6722_12605 [Bacteroidota bacterium]